MGLFWTTRNYGREAIGINKVWVSFFFNWATTGINKWVTIGRLLKTTTAAKRPPF